MNESNYQATTSEKQRGLDYSEQAPLLQGYFPQKKLGAGAIASVSTEAEEKRRQLTGQNNSLLVCWNFIGGAVLKS
jgi:hypothetical protein